MDKVWNDNNNSDNIRLDNVTVQLVADGNPVADKTAILNEINNWSASFTDLPKYANGRQIAYTVKEISTQGGYSVAITSNETEDGTFSYTVTNTHTPTSGEVLISKRDVGGSEIKGATLKLTAENDVTSDGQSFQPMDIRRHAGEAQTQERHIHVDRNQGPRRIPALQPHQVHGDDELRW